MAVANLLLRISAQGGPILERTRGQMQKLDREAAKTGRTVPLVTRAFRGAAAAMGPFIGPAAAGGVILGLGRILDGAVKLGGELDKMSARTGVASDSLLAFRQAGELADVTPRNLERGLIELNESLVEATEGNNLASRAFEELGVSVTNADGSLRSTDAVFRDTVQALSEVDNTAERTALAMDVLGERAGPRLLPLINQGAAAFEEFGGVIGPNFSANAARFEDQLTLMQQGLGNVGLRITDAVLPALVSMLDGALALGDYVGDLFAPLWQQFGNFLNTTLAPAFTATVTVIGEMLEVFGGLGTVAAGTGNLFIQFAEFMGGQFLRNLRIVGRVVLEMIDQFFSLGQIIAGIFQRDASLILEGIRGVFSLTDATARFNEVFNQALTDATATQGQFKNEIEETNEAIAGEGEGGTVGAIGMVTDAITTMDKVLTDSQIRQRLRQEELLAGDLAAFEARTRQIRQQDEMEKAQALRRLEENEAIGEAEAERFARYHNNQVRTREIQETINEASDANATILESMEATFRDIGEYVGNQMVRGITGIIRGTDNWGRVLSRIGGSILNQIIQQLIRIAAFRFISSIFGGGVGAALFPTLASATGRFAEGGVVNRPTRALIGEAGPEAVIPLRSGAVPVQFTDPPASTRQPSVVNINISQTFEGTTTPEAGDAVGESVVEAIRLQTLPGGLLA